MMEDNTTNDQRKKYTLGKDGRGVAAFTPTANSMYIHSNEFVSGVATSFRKLFADFQGCLFEVSAQGVPYVSFYFNHANNANASLPCACELVNGANSKGSDVISRARQRDNLMREGDRYVLTDDAKDIFADLIPDNMKGKNGKVDWKRYVSESCDPTLVPNQYDRSNWGKPHVQYTLVAFTDIHLLAKMMFGTVDDEIDGSDIYDYQVIKMGAITPPMMIFQTAPRNLNYMLEIKRVPRYAMQKICESVGVVQNSGLITGL